MELLLLFFFVWLCDTIDFGSLLAFQFNYL